MIASVSKYVPTITKKVLGGVTGLQKQLHKQKHQLHSTFRHTLSSSVYVAYTYSKSQLSTTQAKCDQQLIDKLHTNPKALYET